jgi:hypothetical protein
MVEEGNVVDARRTVARVPWKAIAFWLIVALAGAWFIGFAIGLAVRWRLGAW